SVIIPNFNGAEHLRECLGSLQRIDYAGKHDVLVVDNGSSDDSVGLVHREFPRVRVVQTGSNLGFAGACNAGARVSESRVIAFLNNDMRVEPNWLTELVAPLQAISDVAATGGLILSWDGQEIDFVGGSVNFYGHGFQPRHGRPAAEAHGLLPSAALFACGGSMGVRRD